ncbi:MAG TPA: GNAT family N-acetyltransferase [Jatrophihabitans sp.]|jgi:predicted acetyltransferase|uniref:GNAT family N-acetyltransferase n=1 Tax=Jatrophihabitans sp. TaxID=1932789 RepID=UPI002DFDBB08|nr:GNAT family N-acetyltransferase [Jatrophihabitans sp.]
MGLEIRSLRESERDAGWELRRHAFGFPASVTPPATPPPGVVRIGAFDGDRLVGTLADLADDQWWDGEVVASSDIGGVAVLPEYRRGGVGRAMLRHVLASARERGAAISTLFPTVAAAYRASGWVTVGRLRTVDLPTHALRVTPGDAGLTLRPGTVADLPAIADLYTAVARARCGLLTRQGGRFGERTELPDDGLSLVCDGDDVVGYASWEHTGGYHAGSVLTVPDLLATTDAAARELAAMLAGWASVAPTLRLRPLAFDAFSRLLPWEIGTEHSAETLMLRPVDVVAAVAQRGWVTGREGRVVFALHDPLAPWNTGTWSLEVSGGGATLTPSSASPSLELTVAGFGLLYAGAASAALLLQSGDLRAPTPADARALDLLLPSSPAQVLDYF